VANSGRKAVGLLEEIVYPDKYAIGNVELIGYAASDDELFLIYEYTQKGSLRSHIHNPQSKGSDCRVCGDPHSRLCFAFVEFADENIAPKLKEGVQPTVDTLGDWFQAYEVKIGDQLYRKPGDPSFDDVFAEVQQEKQQR
ncbi:LysM domain receptor-like kinase 3, partial [Tanacetum coccineum]